MFKLNLLILKLLKAAINLEVIMEKKKLLNILSIITFITLIFSSCYKKDDTSKHSKTNLMLGTVCTITTYDGKNPEKAIDKAFDRIREIEDKMSINKEGTEVDEINAKAGEEFVKVSDDTFDVIKRGVFYSKASNGKFDISIGPIVKLWNIGTDYARVPSDNEIKEKLPLVDYKDIILDEDGKRVKLNKKGMVIDLGAIAKGYAADEVKKVLTDNGVKHALINLGGNVYALGSNVNGEPWKIGVQNPFDTRGAYFSSVKVKDQTVVTSGIYERYVEKDGKKYHHILDTKTGYPVENSLASVTIVADKSIDADGLSTSVFAMGLDEGKKFVENTPGVDAIFVTKNKEVYITSGLKDSFSIVDNSFKLK